MNIKSILVQEVKFTQTTKPHNLPIFATSSFNFEDIDQGINIFEGNEEGHVYGRYGNPTIETVAEKIVQLECYDIEEEGFGIMVSSGMSAISTLLFALLKQGDTILTQANLYGGTTELLRKFITKLGVKIEFIDFASKDLIESRVKNDKSIKLIYCESPANPSLACVDLQYISDLCQKNDILSIIDNTFPTPYLQRPFNFGIDFIIHSTTKYINGHGNSIAGVVIGKNRDYYQTVLDAMKLIGTNCNPFDAWLVNSGMKTLALRMDAHSSNALEIARRLLKHEEIAVVNYPFLPSHRDFKIASKQMQAGGGMLSFELKGGIERAIRFMNAIQMSSLAPTLGDVDTLILHPASMSHRNIERSIRYENGITDGLIRMSVGIEYVEDIYMDIENAIEKSK